MFIDVYKLNGESILINTDQISTIEPGADPQHPHVCHIFFKTGEDLMVKHDYAAIVTALIKIGQCV